MQSKETTVAKYLASLPADRRAAISAVRKVILDNLDGEFREQMQYGMIGYCVPHSVFPPGYHCSPDQPLPFAGLASQKSHMALYLMHVYADNESARRFKEAWTKSGKKLDMGKSCIRFKKLEDVPLDVIGQTIAGISARKWVETYQAILDRPRPGRPAPAAAKSKAKARPKSKPKASARKRKA